MLGIEGSTGAVFIEAVEEKSLSCFRQECAEEDQSAISLSKALVYDELYSPAIKPSLGSIGPCLRTSA